MTDIDQKTGCLDIAGEQSVGDGGQSGNQIHLRLEVANDSLTGGYRDISVPDTTTC